ncbi:hypothetical protein FHR92_000795 [Fontibacillus solani]|uniref:Uncharacterized protein n=1 Tax=Fontibacillus solani TaxID=1572857 RepID=A0A7W3SQH0_9BACL|nr:hypothetical protein [Fontibacillus solani]
MKVSLMLSGLSNIKLAGIRTIDAIKSIFLIASTEDMGGSFSIRTKEIAKLNGSKNQSGHSP